MSYLPSSDDVSASPLSFESFEYFEYFPLLPTELRLKIWDIVLAPFKSQLITFSLSGPRQPQFGYLRRPNGDRMQYPWTHLSSDQRPSTILLQVCRESRSHMLPYFKPRIKGLEVSLRLEDMAIMEEHYVECPKQREVRFFNRELFWDPGEAVITLLEAAEDVPLCAKTSTDDYRAHMCNSNSTYQFVFDDRVRYLAMTEEMWNIRNSREAICFRGLQVIFILVDKANKEGDLGSDYVIGNQHANDTSGADWRDTRRAFNGAHMDSKGELILNQSISRGIRKDTVEVAVKLVESVEQIFREVKLRHMPALG